MDEESLVQYGTPLQPLDEDNVYSAKAQRLSDQVVTDKQGRRRFHGAFTGGFSAGFFNSVGSKEGWAPSLFVSTRSKRAEKLSKNDPITYMDEEDMDSFGIAAERTQATSDYDDPRTQNKRKKMDDWRGPIPGKPVLEELLKPVNTTVGMKLLMKLGWRPGQGIGPRVSRIEKRRTRTERERLQGKAILEKRAAASSSDSEEEEAEHDARVALGFAPDDIDGGLWKDSKSDFFGLGYIPLERGNVLGGKFQPQPFNMIEKQKKISIKGQAFGVGAFEEDDENIYSREDMSEYDFVLGPSSGDVAKRKDSSRWDINLRGLEEDLEGFRLSCDPLPKPKFILLPHVPQDFRPWHESYRRRFESESRHETSGRLSCEERKRIVSNPPSVEIRSGVKKMGATVVQGNGSPSPGSSSFLSTFVEAPQVKEEFIPPSSSSADLKTKPFAAYPEKQKRFEAYLTKGKELTGVFPPFMTEWEREREEEEFARASGIRKPLFSLTMSSRFTPASFDDGPMKGFSEGLNTMKKVGTAEEGTASGSILVKEETREDVKAARTKMFGHITQTRCEWHPDKILCKRFNVPHPFPHSTSVGVPSQSKEKLNIFNFLSDTRSPSISSESLKTEATQPLLQQTKEQEENYGLKVPVSDPPTLDLFKAIFEDSSGSETESETEDGDTAPNSDLSQKKEVGNTEKQSASPPGTDRRLSKSRDPSFGRSSVCFEDSSPKEDDKKKQQSTATQPQKELDPNYITSRAKGVFKGIDFAALNEYRATSAPKGGENGTSADATQESPKKSRLATRKTNERGRRRSDSHSSGSSSSSSENSDKDASDSFPTLLDDDEYGPPLPAHMLRGANQPGNSPKSLVVSFHNLPLSRSLLEIEEKKKKKHKKHKHKHKHKHNKQKKKTKKKESKRHK